jgi:hypothetical protein
VVGMPALELDQASAPSQQSQASDGR